MSNPNLPDYEISRDDSKTPEGKVHPHVHGQLSLTLENFLSWIQDVISEREGG